MPVCCTDPKTWQPTTSPTMTCVRYQSVTVSCVVMGSDICSRTSCSSAPNEFALPCGLCLFVDLVARTRLAETRPVPARPSVHTPVGSLCQVSARLAAGKVVAARPEQRSRYQTQLRGIRHIRGCDDEERRKWEGSKRSHLTDSN